MAKDADPDAAKQRALHMRDHLANERTLLSWIRLGIGLTGLGFVIARFGIFLEQLVISGQARAATPHFSVPVGVALVLLGPLLAGLAARRFFTTEREIAAEQAAPDYHLLYLILVAVTVVGIVLAAYLIYVWLSLGTG
jgi:putative membrane protein